MKFSEDTSKVSNELSGAVSLFEKIYNEKNPGRKLEWVLSLGNAELNFTTSAKQKFLFIISTYQLIIFTNLYNQNR